jgi:hypothetical protein
MKQIDEKYLCKTCRGCNRLELETFQGIYRCNNYIKGGKENEQSNKPRIC